MVIVLLGVTNSGKTMIGKLLSEELSRKYYDAEDFHPKASVRLRIYELLAVLLEIVIYE